MFFKITSISLRFFLLLTLFVLSSFISYSQQKTVNVALDSSIVKEFNIRLSPQVRLFNGPSYIGYEGKLVGSPYLLDTAAFMNGDVSYDGFDFLGVPLMYDMVKEKLISLLPVGYTEFSLHSEKVASFNIAGRHFINVNKVYPQIPVAQSGFMEQTYNGDIKVLVKPKKEVKEIVDTYGLRKEFLLSLSFFILTKDWQLHPISNERSFLKLFPANKAALRKFSKEHKIKFNRNPVATLNELSKFYDALSK